MLGYGNYIAHVAYACTTLFQEWISCATIIYVINELTANAQQYSTLLDKIDLYMMPVNCSFKKMSVA
jgi:murein tripeptide amidase MpaA